MKDSDTVRLYSEKDKRSVLDIVDLNWGKEALAIHEYYWDWHEQFKPTGTSQDNASIVVDSKGTVKAYLRVVPCKVKVGAQRLEGGFLFDVLSDPRKRGGGIKLLREVIHSKYIYIGVPKQRAAELIIKIAKENLIMGKFTKIIGAVNPKALLSKHGVPAMLAGALSSLWKAYLRLNIYVSKRYFSGKGVLSEEEGFTDEVDALFEEFSKKFFFICLKDKGYLTWRFCDSPVDYNKVFLRDNGQLVGYMVYRMGHLNGRPIMLIMEAVAIGEQHKNYTAMLNHVYALALERGVSDIQSVFSGCEAFWQCMRHKGALKKVEDGNIIGNVALHNIMAGYDNKRCFISLADGDFEVVDFAQKQ